LEAISGIPKTSIAYVDETGIDTFLHRDYCRSKRGAKIVGSYSGKKYKCCGIVAAKIGKKIISPLQYDGTMDSTLFELWFVEILIPALLASTTIAMDNTYPQEGGRIEDAVCKANY